MQRDGVCVGRRVRSRLLEGKLFVALFCFSYNSKKCSPPLFRRAVGSVLFPLCHRVEPAPSWALCVFYHKTHLRNNKNGSGKVRFLVITFPVLSFKSNTPPPLVFRHFPATFSTYLLRLTEGAIIFRLT